MYIELGSIVHTDHGIAENVLLTELGELVQLVRHCRLVRQDSGSQEQLNNKRDMPIGAGQVYDNE